MTRYTLHIPEQYNDGSPVAPEYFATVEQAVEDIAGGWTLTHGIGGWRGEDSRYREPVRLYALDTDEPLARNELQQLAAEIGQALGQEAVYLTAQTIISTLISPAVIA